MPGPSKLHLPSQFYSFSCCLSLCLLLSLFLVAISLFSVPRVPQSYSAEGDTIPRVEFANELTAAKNSHSSLSTDGTLHEWYLSLPVVAECFYQQTAHCGFKGTGTQSLEWKVDFFFFFFCKVQLLMYMYFSGEVYLGEVELMVLSNPFYLTNIWRPGTTAYLWCWHKRILMAARFIGFKWAVINLQWPLCWQSHHLLSTVIFDSQEAI